MRARRNPDGSYLLNAGRLELDRAREQIVALGGRWDEIAGCWEVPEKALEPLRAERDYGVVREGYCHTPPGFSWATQREVDAGRCGWFYCNRCKNPSGHRPAIIDVCGEADVARTVYNAEFRARVEATAG